VSEFDAIRTMVARWGSTALGIGGDAAELTIPDGQRLLVSTDTSVEGIHFRRDWLTRSQIGFRSAVASLSDLAAEGARAAGVLVSLALPLETPAEHAAEIMEGVGNAAALVGAKVLGGDLSQAPLMIVDVCSIGTAPRPVRRRGAEAGDGLWVTGRLGAMELALRELRSGRAPEPSVLERFTTPEPRIQAGQWLASQSARAMIDISDGLSADARHLAAASAVAIEISLERLPCWPGAGPLTAASSGEEYELLVSMPPAFGETQAQAFTGLVATPLTRIGTVVDGPAGSVRFTERGVEVAAPAGFDHFAD